MSTLYGIQILARVILGFLVLSNTNGFEEEDLPVNKENMNVGLSGKVSAGRTAYNHSIPVDFDFLPEFGMKTRLSVGHERRTVEEVTNVLLIQTDQQRFDMLGSIQKMLPHHKDKIKIHTPNLDKLMERGTAFTRHYAQGPSCGPSRGTMRTGCTIERTGIQTNALVNEEMFSRNKLFEDKINDLVGFDQVLTSRGYNCEVYGKWHVPTRLKFMDGDGKRRAVRYDSYDYTTGKHIVAENPACHVNPNLYRPCLEVFEDQLRKEPKKGEQISTSSRYPYTPTRLDSRYGMAPGATAKGESSQIGRDSLSRKFTTSYCQAIPIPSAMERLANEKKPWLLDISYNAPHAPFIATGDFFDGLWEKKDGLFTPPSIDIDHLENSPYGPNDKRFTDPDIVKEWMVSYYALIEEVDFFVGEHIQMLDKLGQTKNTLVIFTSDHGEHLGAHGKKGKWTFYEEAMRVPMILSLPGQIPAGKKIDIPTSSLDLFPTILDYTSNSDLDHSDGKSLRRFIDDTNFNEDYDHEVVVGEDDRRNPLGDGSIGELMATPHLMVVKGDYKLMIHKSASIGGIDTLFNVEKDPFEMNNLVGKNGLSASDDVIGKAEHLKVLAVEWMKRMDGPKKYFSDPKYNGGVGKGYIAEVNARRKWKKLSIWISDSSIRIGKPVLRGGYYERNEYIYLGRSSEGSLNITNIKLVCDDGDIFKLGGFIGGVIKSGEYRMVRITFRSKKRSAVDDAQVIISHSEGADRSIKLIGYDSSPSSSSCIKMKDGQLPNSYGRGTAFLPGSFICLGKNKLGLTKAGRIVYMVGSEIVWEPSNSKRGATTRMWMQKGGHLVAYGDKGVTWSSAWPSGDEWVAERVPNSTLFMLKEGATIWSPDSVVTWRLKV